MKKKKRISETRKEYNRQRKRIQNFISRNKKRGFLFDENILPKIPKRVTQSSVNRLKKLTPEKLYSKATHLDTETGEITKGLQASKELRRKAREKAKRRKQKNDTIALDDTITFEDIVISNTLARVSQFRSELVPVFENWMDRLIQDNGRLEVAKMLQKGANEGKIVDFKVMYSETEMYKYFSDMLDFLPDQGDMYKEQVLEILQEEEYEDI